MAWLDKACFEQVKDKLVEAGHHGLDTASVDELRVVDRHLAVGDVVAHESDPLGQVRFQPHPLAASGARRIRLAEASSLLGVGLISVV